MRKTFVTLLTLVLMTLTGFAGKVEVGDARLVARNFIYEQTGTLLQESSFAAAYTEMSGENALFHLFTIDGKGFIIVSADDASYPVIGYSMTSPWFQEELPEHFAYWMDHYKAQIELGISSNLVADEATSAVWNHLRTTDISALKVTDAPTDVAPLVSSMWDQSFPWNGMCPEDNCGGSFNGRVPVGCVATAMTQLMHYWRHPATGVGQHCIFPQPAQYGAQCANFGNTTYYWNAMTNAPTKECDPLAELSWHGGISVDMDYDCDGSGAQTSDVPYALRTYFRYSNSALFVQKTSYSTNDWNTLLKNDLDAGKPLEYSGYGSGGGHAWVCDGYQGTDYFHMNWGWGGYGNGYFYLNNLNPPGYTFNNGQSAVIHITPDATYPTGCNGTTVVDAWDFGSFEDGSGPVADYPNNQNCSWLVAPDDSIENITLSFARFNTATGDEVKVYDGSSASAPLLGTFSGSSIPSNITSTGPALFVTFTTDGSGTAQGWLAEFTCNTADFCGGTTILTDPTGDISDGSGRFDYRNSTNCKWKIQPADAATVTLSFDSFSSEAENDKLQVYDLSTGTLLEVVSGDYSTPPDPITAPGGEMMLIFTANKTVRGEGFVASYSITTGTEEEAGLAGLTIYPNPADKLVNVKFNSPVSQQITIELITMKGSVVARNTTSVNKGQVHETIDVTNIPGGVYLLKVSGEMGVSNSKIIVQ